MCVNSTTQMKSSSPSSSCGPNILLTFLFHFQDLKHAILMEVAAEFFSKTWKSMPSLWFPSSPLLLSCSQGFLRCSTSGSRWGRSIGQSIVGYFSYFYVEWDYTVGVKIGQWSRPSGTLYNNEQKYSYTHIYIGEYPCVQINSVIKVYKV